MSYQEQAQRINKDMTDFFNSPLQQLSNNQKEFILNTIIQVGQVAKFRCRSNTAYDNFISCCFDGLAETKRVVAKEGDDWATLRAFVNKEEKIKEGENGENNI